MVKTEEDDCGNSKMEEHQLDGSKIEEHQLDGSNVGSFQAQSFVGLLELELEQKDQLIAKLKGIVSDLTKTPQSNQPTPSTDHSNQNVQNSSPIQQTPVNSKKKDLVLNLRTPQQTSIKQFTTSNVAQDLTPSKLNEDPKTKPTSSKHSKLLSSKKVSTIQIKAEHIDPVGKPPAILLSSKALNLNKTPKSVSPVEKSPANLLNSKVSKVLNLNKTPKKVAVKEKRCVECREKKKIYVFEKCKPCYDQTKTHKKAPTILECGNCDELKPIYKSQLCRACYFDKHPHLKKTRKRAKCVKCKEIRAVDSFGRCNTCYMKSKPKRKCEACGEIEVIHAKNMCQPCYELNKSKNSCHKCNKIPVFEENLCNSCYYDDQKIQKRHKNFMKLEKEEEMPGPSNLTATEFSLKKLAASVTKPEIEYVEISSGSESD